MSDLDRISSPPRDSAIELAAGTVFAGKYTLLRRLGGGAMGSVHEVRHRITGGRFALKVLHHDPVELTPAQLERFMREAQAASEIGHEGVVQVFDSGSDPTTGRLWLAMELLEGETLADALERPEVTRLELLEWARAVLWPLEAAHRAGIVHRDLKPENVFIARAGDRAKVKILDFGIARPVGKKTATQTGIALGTPAYMSPEQALKPSAITTRADIWSFGVMLYEIVCGALPFDGESAHAIVLAAAAEAHQPLDQRASHEEGKVPEPLCRLVDRCLSKNPEERPSAAEAAEVLDALLADPVARAQLEGRVERASKPGPTIDATSSRSVAFQSPGASEPKTNEPATSGDRRPGKDVRRRGRPVLFVALAGLVVLGAVLARVAQTSTPRSAPAVHSSRPLPDPSPEEAAPGTSLEVVASPPAAIEDGSDQPSDDDSERLGEPERVGSDRPVEARLAPSPGAPQSRGAERQRSSRTRSEDERLDQPGNQSANQSASQAASQSANPSTATSPGGERLPEPSVQERASAQTPPSAPRSGGELAPPPAESAPVPAPPARERPAPPRVRSPLSNEPPPFSF